MCIRKSIFVVFSFSIFVSVKGTLLPRLPAAQGQTRVAVRVDKIGLKDATQYLESYISVSLRGTTIFLCLNIRA